MDLNGFQLVYTAHNHLKIGFNTFLDARTLKIFWISATPIFHLMVQYTVLGIVLYGDLLEISGIHRGNWFLESILTGSIH